MPHGLGVQEGGEDGTGVDPGEAEPLDGAGGGEDGEGALVAEDGVVLDGGACVFEEPGASGGDEFFDGGMGLLDGLDALVGFGGVGADLDAEVGLVEGSEGVFVGDVIAEEGDGGGAGGEAEGLERGALVGMVDEEFEDAFAVADAEVGGLGDLLDETIDGGEGEVVGDVPEVEGEGGGLSFEEEAEVFRGDGEDGSAEGFEDEGDVARGEAEVWAEDFGAVAADEVGGIEGSEALAQVVEGAAGDDGDTSLRESRGEAEVVHDARGGAGEVGVGDDGGEGAVEIDGEEEARGAGELVEAVAHGLILQAVHELFAPLVDVVAFDAAAEEGHAHAGVGLGHAEGELDGVDELVEVSGVDDEGAGEFAGGAGELAEDEDAAVVGSAGDVFLGDEVHAVAEWGDEHDVGDGVVGDEVFAGEVPTEVMDGDAAGLAELAVDATDMAFDFVADGGVVGDGVTAWGGDLDEDAVVGVGLALFEEFLEGFEAAEDSLGVVEAVDGEEDLAVFAEAFAEVAGSSCGFGRLGAEVEPVVVDGDGEGASEDVATLVVEEGAAGLDVAVFAAEADEVLCGAVGLEADDVGAEHAFEDLSSPGEPLEEFFGGEGDVEEEADAKARAGLADDGGDELEVVVVDPDEVARLGFGDGGTGEAFVDVDVAIPPIAMELRGPNGVVVEGPEGPVGHAVVEVFDVLSGEADGSDADAVVFEGADGGFAAGPADPDAWCGLEDGSDGGDEAAGGGLPAGAGGGGDAMDGEAIGDDDEGGIARRTWGCGEEGRVEGLGEVGMRSRRAGHCGAPRGRHGERRDGTPRSARKQWPQSGVIWSAGRRGRGRAGILRGWRRR